jgi:hypothetical protein
VFGILQYHSDKQVCTYFSEIKLGVFQSFMLELLDMEVDV